MIVDIKIIHEHLDNSTRFKDAIMLEVEIFQRKGYRVEVLYASEYKAMVIARECDWIGHNN